MTLLKDCTLTKIKQLQKEGLSQEEATLQTYNDMKELAEQYEFVQERLDHEQNNNYVTFLGIKASLASLNIIYSAMGVAITAMINRNIQFRYV